MTPKMPMVPGVASYVHIDARSSCSRSKHREIGYAADVTMVLLAGSSKTYGKGGR